MSLFNYRFRPLKDESDLTLKDLSMSLNITVLSLSYYMKGREPNYDILITIADYFNVTTDWLIGRTDARNPTQSSIISAIEKQLKLKEEDMLSGEKKKLFLGNQSLLYSAMVDMYGYFLVTGEDFCKDFNIYLNISCLTFNYYIREFNIAVRDFSKESVLTLIKNEEIVADTLHTLILLSAYNYANYLSYDDDFPKNEQNTLNEIISFTFNNFKEKYPDSKIQEMFSKMDEIQNRE